MEVVYKIKTEELNLKLVENIKSLFQDEEIIISIVSAKKNKKITPEYSQKILKSLNNIEEGKVVYLNNLDFEELSKKLLK